MKDQIALHALMPVKLREYSDSLWPPRQQVRRERIATSLPTPDPILDNVPLMCAAIDRALNRMMGGPTL